MDAALDRLLSVFESTLPEFPRCTNNFSYGVVIRHRSKAKSFSNIQTNQPNVIAWLPFDVDRASSHFDWEDRSAPPPNLVAMNPSNGHSHLLYGFEAPIHVHNSARKAPQVKLDAINKAIRTKLDSDVGYSQFTVKNPLNTKAWQIFRYEPQLYTLDWIGDYLDTYNIQKNARRIRDIADGGRNCDLFSRLARWAYKEAQSDEYVTLEQWGTSVLQKAIQYNDFEIPLGVNEIKSTAKSVSKYCWINIISNDGTSTDPTTWLTKEKWAQKRREASLVSRRKKADKKRLDILEARERNPRASIRDLAVITKFSIGTVHHTIKNFILSPSGKVFSL